MRNAVTGFSSSDASTIESTSDPVIAIAVDEKRTVFWGVCFSEACF